MEGKAKNKVGWLQAFMNLLKKDSKEENESNKRVLIIRLISIAMCVYFLTLFFLFLPTKATVLIAAAAVCGLGNAAILLLTYYNKSAVAYWLQNAMSVAWVMFFVVMLGWDCGVQHFVFVIVVSVCFVTFDKSAMKVMYIVFLCAVRLGLYFYTSYHEPVFAFTELYAVEFQIVNTLVIFICVSIISLIIGNFSQEAEKKLVLYNKRLQKMANMDELTGLMNRRSVTLALEEEYKTGHRECTDSIAIGDIDFFKRINDEYGHECGDLVLRELSKLLAAEMADKGIVARWGGEEFLFVFEQINGDSALMHLWDILYKIRSMKIPYMDKEIQITMTFGLEEYNGIDYEKTIRKADDKLYMGKSKGRNQIVY